MDGEPGGRRPRRLPWGFLGLIVLVGLIEAFVSRRGVDFKTPEGWDWSLAGRRDPRCDILCFGDSLVKFGVMPRVIEGRTGRRALNLALRTGSAPSSYFLLKRALARGRPSAIVVDFAMGILPDGPKSTTRPYPWSELLEIPEALELARTTRDAEFLGRLAASKALPSFADRPRIRAGVLAALKGEPSDSGQHIPILWRNWRANGGAQLNPRNPAFRDPYAGMGAAPGSGTWRPDPVNAIYVEKFLALAEARGVAVYWLLPPFTPGLQGIHDGIGDAKAYHRYTREAIARHPNVVVVDGQHSGYDAGLFIDPVHLDRQGAAVLSADLAEIVASPPPGTRWVALPTYRERPINVPLEDTGESRIALNARGSSLGR